ncbi:MAG: hypothetical protein KI793_07575 [Rivularia sp. (in: Bacteria)]|nr:hypothetical protein [Rivularia sp. MS3]
MLRNLMSAIKMPARLVKSTVVQVGEGHPRIYARGVASSTLTEETLLEQL